MCRRCSIRSPRWSVEIPVDILRLRGLSSSAQRGPSSRLQNHSMASSSVPSRRLGTQCVQVTPSGATASELEAMIRRLHTTEPTCPLHQRSRVLAELGSISIEVDRLCLHERCADSVEPSLEIDHSAVDACCARLDQLLRFWAGQDLHSPPSGGDGLAQGAGRGDRECRTQDTDQRRVGSRAGAEADGSAPDGDELR